MKALIYLAILVSFCSLSLKASDLNFEDLVAVEQTSQATSQDRVEALERQIAELQSQLNGQKYVLGCQIPILMLKDLEERAKAEMSLTIRGNLHREDVEFTKVVFLKVLPYFGQDSISFIAEYTYKDTKEVDGVKQKLTFASSIRGKIRLSEKESRLLSCE